MKQLLTLILLTLALTTSAPLMAHGQTSECKLAWTGVSIHKTPGAEDIEIFLTPQPRKAKLRPERRR